MFFQCCDVEFYFIFPLKLEKLVDITLEKPKLPNFSKCFGPK
jgi:hypothetical protein